MPRSSRRPAPPSRRPPRRARPAGVPAAGGRPRARAAGRRRGAVLPFVCLLLTVLIAAAALAIDLGRLYATAAQVQSVTDAAAMAGAAGLQFTPSSATTAVPARAAQFAALNRAAGLPGSVAAGDVIPTFYDPAANTATPATSYVDTVNAVRTTARARAAYVLAGALGLAPPTVARSATAWIGNMTGGACMRPVAPSYTRIYEVANSPTARPYSSLNKYAPDLTQTQIAQLSPKGGLSAVARTFVLLPPWSSESYWDQHGQPITGLWHTVNFGNAGWPAFRTYMGAAVGSATCAAATAQDGTYLTPFAWKPVDSLYIADDSITPGFVQLCHQFGNSGPYDATCRNADGTVGVVARVPLSDSIPNPKGTFSQKVRMVTQLRIMCYFQKSSAKCASTQIKNGAGQSITWQMPSAYPGGPPVDSAYTPATVVVMLEGPVYIDLTPDVVLGNTPSLTQRLVLVK